MNINETTTEYKFAGIYKITNLVNMKIYIGQAKDIHTRMRHHATDERNIHLKRAFEKYGVENFELDIIERCDVKKLDEREQYWMDYYQACKNGYNISPTASSTRGMKKTKEECKRISDFAKQRIGKKNPFYGKQHTEYTKKILSENAIGREISEDTKNKISKANTGKKRTDSQKTNISNALKGKEKSETHRNNMAKANIGKKLTEETKDKISKSIKERIQNGSIDYSDKCKKVKQIDKDTNEVIRIFDSITSASKHLGHNNNTLITYVCKHKPHYKTAYGYKWEYV